MGGKWLMGTVLGWEDAKVVELDDGLCCTTYTAHSKWAKW